ncbi:MAG: hypothetical protein U5L06_01260 [Rhodovibrio sp.]|nr:hypothetical protein [Rhodovibrio sp.]
MPAAQALAQDERVLRADRDDQAEAKTEALPSGAQKREQTAIDVAPRSTAVDIGSGAAKARSRRV